MKWILIFIMFNNGLHYAQSQPQMYHDYDECQKAAADVKRRLDSTSPNDKAYALSFCVSLPNNV